MANEAAVRHTDENGRRYFEEGAEIPDELLEGVAGGKANPKTCPKCGGPYVGFWSHDEVKPPNNYGYYCANGHHWNYYAD